MKNIRPYQADHWRAQFMHTEIYQKIKHDFDVVHFDKLWQDSHQRATPRHELGDPLSIFSATIFYYLEPLIARAPRKIYDLGCGWNIFKRYLPNVVGVGAEDPTGPDFFADLHDYVDDAYIAGHQAAFDAVICICALHFVPLSAIAQQVTDFHSMLRPGGCGCLTFNAARMIERDERFSKHDLDQAENFIRQELTRLPIQWIILDVDLSVYDETMDGNIRLVMQK